MEVFQRQFNYNEQSDDYARTSSPLTGRSYGHILRRPAFMIDGVLRCNENLPLGRIPESIFAFIASMMRGIVDLPGG